MYELELYSLDMMIGSCLSRFMDRGGDASFPSDFVGEGVSRHIAVRVELTEFVEEVEMDVSKAEDGLAVLGVVVRVFVSLVEVEQAESVVRVVMVESVEKI